MNSPLSMAELTALPITQLQQHLQRGKLAAREISDITLVAIAQRHPTLNAYTQVTGQRMQREADALDARRLCGEVLPPLAGVPYAVKNLFDVAGETTLAGAQLFADNPPAKRDAFALRQGFVE